MSSPTTPDRAGGSPRPDDGADRDDQQHHPDEGTADVIPTIYTDARDVTAIGELAEAERAAARHGTNAGQARGLRAVAQARRTEDRVALWRSDQERRSADGPGPR